MSEERCIGVAGEGCFRPAVEAGRCKACVRAWYRYGQPKAADVDGLFSEITAALARYADTPLDTGDDEVIRRRAILDEKMKTYVERRFGFVGRKRETIKTLSVERVIAIAQTLPYMERRRIGRECARLPPEVLLRRKQEGGRRAGLLSARRGRLAALAKKGNAVRWGRGGITDDERKWIVALRAEGKSQAEIARLVKVSQASVSKALRTEKTT